MATRAGTYRRIPIREAIARPLRQQASSFRPRVGIRVRFARDGASRSADLSLSGEQLLDALQFFRELEAELLRFVLGQPVRHLGENHLMVAVSPQVPRRFVMSCPGQSEQSPKLLPDFFRIDHCWIAARIFEAQAELGR